MSQEDPKFEEGSEIPITSYYSKVGDPVSINVSGEKLRALLAELDVGYGELAKIPGGVPHYYEDIGLPEIEGNLDSEFSINLQRLRRYNLPYNLSPEEAQLLFFPGLIKVLFYFF